MDLSMTFDELQKTWQKDAAGTKLTIDSNLLLQEVKRNKEHFESAIFWRDVREVAAGTLAILGFLGFAVFFFYRGFTLVALGSAVAALFVLWVVLFFIADRIVQRKRRPSRDKSLIACIEDSLRQLNHQIWLLKNVFWWYLLPPGIGVLILTGSIAWQTWQRHAAGKPMLIAILENLAFVALVFWVAYLLNQRAVRKDLMPRKVELESLLKNLSNDNKAT
jgi:hypothetical protein